MKNRGKGTDALMAFYGSYATGMTQMKMIMPNKSECPSCHHEGLRFIGEEKIEDGSPPVLRHYSICFQCGNYWYYDETMEKAKMYMGLFLNQPMHIENAKSLHNRYKEVR